MTKLLWAGMVLACSLALAAGELGSEKAKQDAKAVLDQKPSSLVPMAPLTNASDALKDIEVGPAKVSFGVQHQTRLEAWDNRFVGPRIYTNGVVFMRTRLWMDWDLHKHLRLFVQGQDASKDGDLNWRKTFWEDNPDLHEAYVDLRKLFGQNLTLRVGRQGLAYGKQRLVGTFEWSNTGRRWDAVRLFWKSDDKTWAADAFASKVVVTDPDGFNESHPTEEFYGLYATNTSFKFAHFDLYAFARLDDNGRTRDELLRRGDQELWTLGGRLWGKEIGGGFDYEVEGAAQFGEAGQASHFAGALHAEAGWTFKHAPWKPRLMAEFNFGSGDEDPSDGESGTFNNLFPTNHLHYGYIDYVNWSNTLNAGFGVSATPMQGIDLWAKSYWFRLHQDQDAWRDAGGAILGRDRTGRSGEYVGFEFDAGGKAVLNKHLNFLAGYSLFEGGEFARNTRASRKGELSQFMYVQLQFGF